MPNLIPYINFQGKSHDAIAFYTNIFDGATEIQQDGDRVIQFDFIASGIHFMGADHDANEIGIGRSDSCSLVLNCDSEHQLTDFYTKLSDGGKEIFAPMDSGWGAIIAHCTDRFGVSWMLNYDMPEAGK